MKRCSKCGQWKKEKDFYKDKTRSDGLSGWCKTCRDEWTYKKRETYRKDKSRNIDALSGYKISILNYTKKDEYKYTIVSTKGDFFESNDKDEFLSKLQEVI